MLAQSYHLRETNLNEVIRTSQKLGLPVKNVNVNELRAIPSKDQQNWGNAQPLGAANELSDKNLNNFLTTYFLRSEPIGAKYRKG
jgi:hypothetical protein